MTTWAPEDLTPILVGQQTASRPSMLYRSDGLALLYDGKDHSGYGEPESCKGWLACLVTAEQLRGNIHVAYFDFEGDAPTVVERLRALGICDEEIAACLHYCRPEEPLTDEDWATLEPFLEQTTLTVIDGFNEALTLHGLDSRDNADVAGFRRRFTRRLHSYGEKTTLEIDHVTKDRENRGRYAIARPAQACRCRRRVQLPCR